MTKSFNCISSLTKRHVYFSRYAENIAEETLVNRKKIQPIPLYICVAPLFMNISFKTLCLELPTLRSNWQRLFFLLIFFFSVYAKSLVSYSSRWFRRNFASFFFFNYQIEIHRRAVSPSFVEFLEFSFWRGSNIDLIDKGLSHVLCLT